MYRKTVSDIWNISLSDLIDINDHLLTAIGEYGDLTPSPDWEEQLRSHCQTLLNAINVMHRLGVPTDSEQSFVTTRWTSDLTNSDVNELIEANASLDWVRSHRNYILN
tara:strand:+ start:2271 stop:2594 length:324 start_codon:yes stop_codon:yes gene_type:complete